MNCDKFNNIRGDKMRSSRIHKKRNKKLYLKSILLTFLVIIPATAIISSMVIYYALNKDKNIDKEAAVFTPVEQAAEAFKYSYDINVKQLYRVEIKKFEEYEDAEAQIAVLKNKKVNGFIVKEQGYLTAYGLFGNKSQADTAAGYLKRKNIESTVNTFDISGINIKYDDMDKNLINIASAVDSAVMKILNEKAALSLESLYSNKKISEKSLDVVIEQEAKLVKYLNYLQDIKTSEANAFYKKSLEDLIKELLVDKLQGDGSYDYYELQNSMMNQGEALKKFYEKSIV
jgi:ABC-type Na+ efflux pump permease subunit